MAYSPPRGSAGGATNPPPKLGLIANAMKRKHSFIQFFAMTGILLLSVRSLGQKYRLHGLREDTYALEEERKALEARTSLVKTRLRAEAAADPSGTFAAGLRTLFGPDD